MECSKRNLKKSFVLATEKTWSSDSESEEEDATRRPRWYKLNLNLD